MHFFFYPVREISDEISFEERRLKTQVFKSESSPSALLIARNTLLESSEREGGIADNSLRSVLVLLQSDRTQHEKKKTLKKFYSCLGRHLCSHRPPVPNITVINCLLVSDSLIRSKTLSLSIILCFVLI